MSAVATEPVPVLPRASELRETVQAVETGLKFLKGLALAVERAERRAIQAAGPAPQEASPDATPATS